MSSILLGKNNFDKKQKKVKITTINLDVTSSSSSSSSSSSKSSPLKKEKQNNNNKEISPPKIKQLFSDSDEEEEENKKKNIKKRKDSEDLTTYGFEKALNKKQFQGEKGKMLLKLQNTYVNDSRFKLDSKFKNDINYNKLPSELKENKKNDLFNYEEIDKEAKTEDIEFEKKKNMSILAEILPNSAFLEHKSIDKPTNKLIIKRFDPTLRLGCASVEAIKVEKKVNKEKEKNLVKLEKGVQIFNDRNDMELYNKYNDINKMKKREKEKLYNDTINRINDEMNQEIIVNYDSWKKGILEKSDNKFSLFRDNSNSNNNNNSNNFSLSGNNNSNIENKDDNNDDNKIVKINNDENNNKENGVKKIKSEKEILRKKKKREKEKLRKKEKERIKKAKLKHKKEKNKRKMDAINKEYEDYLIKEFGEEKANNHLKYIDMIQKYKENKKK